MVGGCQSGGGQSICSVFIPILSKSFGGLFDEIIMLMMVNYLIMWKSAKLILAFENMIKQEIYWIINPYHVSITFTWQSHEW